MPRLFDLDRLQTVHNFAKAYVTAKGKQGVSVGYIYRLIDAEKVEAVVIDGMRFIVLPLPTPKS